MKCDCGETITHEPLSTFDTIFFKELIFLIIISKDV